MKEQLCNWYDGETKPLTAGFYGVTNDTINPASISIVYFDGRDWVAPNNSHLLNGPYRNVHAWCVMKWGKG